MLNEKSLSDMSCNEKYVMSWKEMGPVAMINNFVDHKKWYLLFRAIQKTLLEWTYIINTLPM